MANAWQGDFPWKNLLLDGWERLGMDRRLVRSPTRRRGGQTVLRSDGQSSDRLASRR
jgi:hypothetical protein